MNDKIPLNPNSLNNECTIKELRNTDIVPFPCKILAMRLTHVSMAVTNVKPPPPLVFIVDDPRVDGMDVDDFLSTINAVLSNLYGS